MLKKTKNKAINEILNISKSFHLNPNNYQILCQIAIKFHINKIIDNVNNIVEMTCKCGKKKIELKNLLLLISEIKCKNCNKMIISNKEKHFCNECKGFLCEECEKIHKKNFNYIN